MGELEQLYSAQSARDYDALSKRLREIFSIVDASPDILARALQFQRDLAHHQGMWHRTSVPDLVRAETELYHNLGVVPVNGDFAQFAEVRPLAARRLGRHPVSVPQVASGDV